MFEMHQNLMHFDAFWHQKLWRFHQDLGIAPGGVAGGCPLSLPWKLATGSPQIMKPVKLLNTNQLM